jgi:hypothetical protein
MKQKYDYIRTVDDTTGFIKDSLLQNRSRLRTITE